jgi:hypothetical protein
MNTGILAAAWLCLVLGQTGDNVCYTNQRDHEIPVKIQDAVRANLRELLLYKSDDQGRTWHPAGRIDASKSAFVFYSPGDGTYWFQVAFVNKAGVQDPDDKTIMRGAPQIKMVIDTLKPVVRSFQAQRVGDEVLVTWDVQEEHPDLSRDGFRLEYQAKDSLTEAWKTVPIQIGLKGQVSFTPGDKRALNLRLTVRDLAGNQSYSQAEVTGTVAAAGYSQESNTLPMEMAVPRQPPEPLKVAPPPEPLKVAPPPMDVKPPVFNPPAQDSVQLPPPVPIEHKVLSAPPEALKASEPIMPPPGMMDVKPPVVAPLAPRLPALQYINQHLIKLQYQLKRVGPSGVGSVEIWMTKNDGVSWEPYAKIKEKEIDGEPVQGPQEREFSFSDERGAPFPDGVYGLSLVVKNRAGVGRTPRPGDMPEMRVEIDTTKPEVQMYQPIPDPQHPTQLLFRWNVADKNLTETPVNLEYAESPKGPWLPIELNLKNTGQHVGPKVTGDYSWKVPAGTPVQVYLRVRVRDRAGNESIDAMETRQFVDLVEPEGALIGIAPPTKR